MDKKYKLLKDLPGIEAGVIFTTFTDGMKAGKYRYEWFPLDEGSGYGMTFNSEIVENEPEWFELAK